MRITNLRAVELPCQGAPLDWRTWLGPVLVAVDTDRGLTGYGVGGGGAAGAHVVRTVLRDCLMGQIVGDADVDLLWRRMYRTTVPFGRKGIAIMAISGADLALWDLLGRSESEPVAQLLGKPRRSVPGYATLTSDNDPALSEGFAAYKLPVHAYELPREQEVLIRRLEHLRRHLGSHTPLMIDAYMKWDVTTTLHMDKLLTPCNLSWIEEPLPPDNLAGYAKLRDGCRAPIASGEHEYTAEGFEPIVAERLHAILQPDVCWCGGLTELVKIYHMARRAGLRVCPHRGSEPWSLHAMAVLDPEPLAESGRPWLQHIPGWPECSDGHYCLNDQPGFGLTFDETLLP